MTRKEFLEVVGGAAAEAYDEREAAAVALFLLETMLCVTRTQAMLAPDETVAVLDGFDRILADIRTGRPVQYIAGRTDFCGLPFEVREGVLIPRPETEELVEWVVGAEPGAQSVLDVGTGSGAIAVALAHRLPGAVVRAVDVSADALAVARGNARLNNAEVEFLHADVLAVRSQWEGQWHDGMFDVVVSNPPYIPRGEMPAMHRNVTGYEPHIALFVPDDDALLFYRAIAREASVLLRAGGALYFEVYEGFAAETRELLDKMGYAGIEVRQDINGKDRMVRCRKR